MSSSKKRKGADGDTPPSKKGGGALSTQAIEYLKAWMMSPEHFEHPYPTDEEKEQILRDTGITAKQMTCWFSNNRKRFWKVKMEEMGRHDVVEAAMGSNIPPQTVEYLKAWMMSPEHIQNPFPTDDEKVELLAATGLDKKQLSCWFSNNRKRFWKPQMDKLRKQYGLNESDPIPSVALATLEQTGTAPAQPFGHSAFAPAAAPAHEPMAELPPTLPPIHEADSGEHSESKPPELSASDVVAV